jgi:hypothetical protein
MQNSPAGPICNYLVTSLDCFNGQYNLSSSLQISQDACYIACQGNWRCQSYSWEATKSTCTLYTEGVDAMGLPSTGGTISFSDISCLAPPPAPTCQHNAQEIDLGITYHDIIDDQWCAIQCFATPSCRSWSYDGGVVGIGPEYRFCHLFTQSVAQLSPPASSTKALNNFQYWDMSCHCGAMTSAPPTTLRSPISTTTQPSRAACKALCRAALYCQSYSYNSVGGVCLFWNWSLFNAATLVWDATGTWTSYDHNCP